MSIRVAVNGVGRIGRSFVRQAVKNSELELVALNDLGDIENIAYLLRYDSAYGKADFSVVVSDDKQKLVIDGKEVPFLSEKEPANLPWGEMNVDVVVEATGFFTKFETAKAHQTAGAKKVVISAPAKDEPADDTQATVLMGVNEDKLATCQITSNGSCTTNAGSPLIQILNETIGVEKAVLNTTHGYTASQSLVDGPSKKDLRVGRAAAQNIIPTSTGAAIAVTKALPELSGKFDGIATRVPVIAGSIVDVTFIAKRPTSAEEVNQVLVDASNQERWQGIFGVTNEPLVSVDIIGNPLGSMADLSMTRVVDGTLVKVCAWYDNEAGYTNTLVQHVIKTGRYLN